VDVSPLFVYELTDWSPNVNEARAKGLSKSNKTWQNIPLDNMIDSLAPAPTERADAAANRLRILQVAEELFAAGGSKM
jgi:hypothetical protein